MLAVFAGALGAFGFMYLTQRRLFAHWFGHRHGSHGGHGLHGWGGPGPGCRGHGHGFRRRRHRRGARFRLHALMDELDTTSDQEEAIGRSLEALWQRLTEARAELDEARRELASLLGGAALDRSALDGVLARYRQLFERASGEVAETLAKVHETLDETQRKRLAELLARGPFGPGWGGGY